MQAFVSKIGYGKTEVRMRNVRIRVYTHRAYQQHGTSLLMGRLPTPSAIAITNSLM